MTGFVLVHGSWHGSWCWFEVVTRLEAAGHRVVAPDLPGHGIDATPQTEVNFTAYVDRVCAAIDAMAEPVTLVGHSMGGHPVTQAAERRAASIETLVYLTAFLPTDGQALTDLDVASHGSAVDGGRVVDEARGVVDIDPAVAAEAFLHDCTAEYVALSDALRRPEPIEPRTAPVSLTEANYGSVRRAYIECTEDRALPITFQRDRQAAVPPAGVQTLQTGHSPFFADPDALTEALLTISPT